MKFHHELWPALVSAPPPPLFIFLKLIVTCKLCAVYVRAEHDSSVTGYDYTTYMDYMDHAVRCPKKPLNLITHTLTPNRLVSQMRAPLAVCREPAGKLWQLWNVLYVFEHKRKYLLIHAPFTRIVVFWHIGNVPPLI